MPRYRVDRRRFVASAALGAAGMLVPRILRAGHNRRKRVLLRSSWQTVNIGDIAHTPGMLTLLEEHLAEVDVTLWPNRLSVEVEQILLRRFPRLQIAKTSAEKNEALHECDFCLHGSGPGLVGRREMLRWQETGKPYGFGGVTLSDAEIDEQRELMAQAKFVFCRDTLSRDALKQDAAKQRSNRCPQIEFGPDATFLLDLRDNVRAEAFLKKHQLSRKQFACFVPRLRFTPYWKDGRKYSPELRAERHAVNEKYQEADHAKLRTAIIAWVRKTGHKALLCPEMTYQVELLRPLLFDPLPEDVKPQVVVRPDFWLTDEAASTYAQATAVVSCEMHGPIIAIAAGTPAIHLRQPTDTRKGQMWRDVGLGDWLFEIDTATGEQIADRLLGIERDTKATQAAVAHAQRFTGERGAAMMQAVANCL